MLRAVRDLVKAPQRSGDKVKHATEISSESVFFMIQYTCMCVCEREEISFTELSTVNVFRV